ncbi:MAG: DoxX family membrane protein [Cyclobacteriaceae bacterium]|nr:DoxX family membrane protein [Cyclobacteriaceae bacterium HetDA_MAG_MS6]
MIRKASLTILITFYVFAGLNHFINPSFYYPLIPTYLPFPWIINLASGLIEVIFGCALLFSFSRKLAAYGLMIMLVAFIPSHIYFIQVGSCIPDGLCVSPWLGWTRLVIVHPLLMYWVYIHLNDTFRMVPRIG